MHKTEIKRRLKKADYTKLPKLLDIANTFDNVTATNDLNNMLQIADTCGMKYLEFYKLKNNSNIQTLINNLEIVTYQPNIPYIQGQGEISVSKLKVNGNDFEILANFYTMDEEWVIVENNRKELQEVRHRRVLHLSFTSNNNKLIITIDPIGDGVKVTQHIQAFLSNIFTTYEISFYDYFEGLSIANSIYSMTDEGLVRPQKLKTTDEVSNRSYDAIAKNPRDSLSDESLYNEARANTLSLNNMRLSYIEHKLNIELFSDDLLKIWSKANWKESADIKENILRFL